MEWWTLFKKKGGASLIINYFRTGALFPALITFCVLGKSRKALEILYLTARFKIHRKLYNRYSKKIDDLLNKYRKDEHKYKRNIGERNIYVCWFQGMENAPDIIKKCYESLKKYINDRKIVLITEKNYRDYVNFPSHIEEKIEKGIISRTHMSDLLRLEILTRYGGTWIDATVLCTDTPPSYMLDSDLFVFQLLRPGLNGDTIGFSSWFITSKPNHIILRATLDVLYDYWYNYNTMLDYFLFHHIFELVKMKCMDEFSKIIPFPNESPLLLGFKMFDEYDETVWSVIKRQSPFHKLTYKFTDEDKIKTNTYFSKIMSDCKM